MGRVAVWSALVALLVAASVHPSAAFKAEDFKNCDDAAFCKRLRDASSTDYNVDPASLTASGARVTARVANAAAPEASFALTLTSYGDFVRLHITEPGANPPRYEVQDVLLPSLPALQASFLKPKTSASAWTGELPGSGALVELTFSPLKLEVRYGGKPAMTWNAAGGFTLEHRRAKGEADPEGWWSENFKTHHDSKPRGPEAISWDLAFADAAHAYGLPERATAHSLPSTRAANGTVLSEPYRLYNLDVFEYLPESPFGLYGSIPLLWTHRPGLTTGAFWLNAAEMYVDVSRPAPGALATHWIAEAGVVDLFLLGAPTPAAAAAQFAALTGGSAMPQMFALGYHQCRWNYKDQEDVAGVDAGFDAHDIPYDVLWLDIEHTDGKRYFTWDGNYFPTPRAMQDDLASRGRKMVTIVDPHIKRDTEWPLFAEATEKGLFVKDREGKDFDGWCWPGSSSYLDHVDPAVRSWWADRFSLDKYNGSTPHLYIWNDMNEPSVFNGPEISMHKDARHAGGAAEHRDVHNVYGYFYHMASADGLRRRGFATAGPDGDRPFVLSRAFFAGTQRVGAIWTGDNGADWDHLAASVPMLLSISVSGLPFAGADVGGFFGNPDAELLTRWYQLGAFYPFFRGHAHLESKRREPWLFGEETTGRIREAIRRRYRLLPYLYTQFFAANATGAPVMRPLWYEFPDEADVAGEDKTFMVGPAVAVAPILRQGSMLADIVLPRGTWYDAEEGTAISAEAGTLRTAAYAPMETIKHYYRGGSVVPLRERARRSTVAAARDPLTLVVALDAAGEAAGEVYLDDGASFAFQRGQYALRRVTFTADGTLAAAGGEVPASAGLPVSDPRYDAGGVVIDRIVVLGLPGGPAGWAVTDAAGAPVSAAPGPLMMKVGMAPNALVLRRTGLPATGAWTLKFSKALGGAAATA